MITKIILVISLLKGLRYLRKPWLCAAFYGAFSLGAKLLIGTGMYHLPVSRLAIIAGLDTAIAFGVFWIMDRLHDSDYWWPAAAVSCLFLYFFHGPAGLVLTNDQMNKVSGVDTRPALLLPGSYHMGEVRVMNGDVWSGIYDSPTGFLCKQVPLAVQPVFDPLMDNKGGLPSAKRITAQIGDNPKQPVFLVKNVVGLAEGPIDTSLKLNESERHHYLGDLEDASFETNILWSGDLDHDGKLDILVKTRPTKVDSVYTLLLSSPAAANELVRPVATRSAMDW